MNNEVTSAIHAVLMEEGQVCLPSLGSFSLSRQPALVSHLEGTVRPPSHNVHFNANLVLDDGRLLKELSENQHLDRAYAEGLIVKFIQQTRESLDAGRSVLLTDIGKLFKHHDGELRFQSSGENFSKNSFGLPAVELQPIIRKERRQPGNQDPMHAGTATGASQSASSTTPAGGKRAKLKGWFNNSELQSILFYVAAGIAILLVLYIAQAVIGMATKDPLAPVREVPRERLNVPPPRPETTTPPTVDANRIQPEEAPRLNEPPTTTPNDNTPPPVIPNTTPVVTDNSAIIAIGLYGRQRNVDKQTGRIREAGFEPYTRPEGRLTRVGVRLDYTNENDLQRVLTDVRRQFAEEAYVMMVNGEERRPQ